MKTRSMTWMPLLALSSSNVSAQPPNTPAPTTLLTVAAPGTTLIKEYIKTLDNPAATLPKSPDSMNTLGDVLGIERRAKPSVCRQGDNDCGDGWCCSAGTTCSGAHQCEAGIGIGGIGIGLGSQPAYQGEASEDTVTASSSTSTSTLTPPSTSLAPSTASSALTSTTSRASLASSSTLLSTSTTATSSLATTTSAAASPTSASDVSSDSAPSSGTIAGAIVGVLVALAVLALIAGYIYRRGKRAGARLPSLDDGSAGMPPKSEAIPMYSSPKADTAAYVSEVKSPVSPIRAGAPPQPVYQPQTTGPSEMDASSDAIKKFEMDGSAAAAPLPSTLRPRGPLPPRKDPSWRPLPGSGAVYEMPG